MKILEGRGGILFWGGVFGGLVGFGLVFFGRVTVFVCNHVTAFRQLYGF